MPHQSSSHRHGAPKEELSTWMAWAGTALPSTDPYSGWARLMTPLELGWGWACGQGRGWLQTRRACSMRFPIQAPLGSQVGVDVITHVYRAFTLCAVQHATRLPLRQAVTTGTGCLCHSRSSDRKQQSPLPCPTVCPSPHPQSPWRPHVSENQGLKWPNFLQTLRN